MSVERGWGRDIKATVQRRGEKPALSSSAYDSLSTKKPIGDRNSDHFPKAKPAAPKIEKWMAGRQSDYPAMIKGRIEQKIAEMEIHPEFAKTLEKTIRRRVLWTIIGIYFSIGFAPILLPVYFIGLFLFVGGVILLPPVRERFFNFIFDTLATFVAANKVKKKSS